MRRPHWYVGLVVAALLGLAQNGWTQEVVRLTIHSVTSEPQANGDVALIVTGVGFGETPEVTVDGQFVPVLAGASDTRLMVLAPPSLLTTPGTYRLTVVDPARQVAGAFIVAALPGTAGVAGLALTESAGASATSGGTVVSGGTSVAGVQPPSVNTVIEDSGSLYRTALGYQALASDAAGAKNTAVGYQAAAGLVNGSSVTAVGWGAVRVSDGSYNTGIGSFSLYESTGASNTAVGLSSMTHSTTGSNNTAVGVWALGNNGAGSYNVAFGENALEFNTGSSNTAVGYGAGLSATTGNWNVYFGTSVTGVAAESNTLRIGKPYSSFMGQNRAFIAGIYDIAVSSGRPVVIDANGQLGTADSSTAFGIGVETPSAVLHVGSATSGNQKLLQIGDPGNVSASGNGVVLRGNSSDGAFRWYGLNAGVETTTPLLVMNRTNGYVGVGTTTPAAPFHVAGTSAPAAYFDVYSNSLIALPTVYRVARGTPAAPSAVQTDDILGGLAVRGYGATGFSAGRGQVMFKAAENWTDSANGTYLQFTTTPTGTANWQERMRIDPAGNVGIGTAAPAFPLHMGSGAYVSPGGVWTNASSRALKDQIVPLSGRDALRAVEALAPVTFVYKAEPTARHVGFIAEDVPELVATPDRKSLSAMDVVAVLTKAVQELRAQKDGEIAALKSQNTDLQARLLRLEALVASLAAGSVK